MNWQSLLSLPRHIEAPIHIHLYGYSSDCAIFLLCSLSVGVFYFGLEPFILTSKGKAWIVMLLSSFVLSIAGLVYLTNAQLNDLWNTNFIYSDSFVSRSIMLFFASCNAMDLVLGAMYYPSFLDPFSTIAHHIFYVAFIATLLSHGYSNGFMLCFVMEVPTFILSLGSVQKSLRSDVTFGISFFLTRIVYNVLLAYRLAVISFDGVIWKICVCVLGLHIFWFTKWLTVYGKNLLLLPGSTTKPSSQVSGL